MCRQRIQWYDIKMGQTWPDRTDCKQFEPRLQNSLHSQLFLWESLVDQVWARRCRWRWRLWLNWWDYNDDGHNNVTCTQEPKLGGQANFIGKNDWKRRNNCPRWASQWLLQDCKVSDEVGKLKQSHTSIHGHVLLYVSYALRDIP